MLRIDPIPNAAKTDMANAMALCPCESKCITLQQKYRQKIAALLHQYGHLDL